MSPNFLYDIHFFLSASHTLNSRQFSLARRHSSFQFEHPPLYSSCMLGPRTRSAAHREDLRAEKVGHEDNGDDEHSPKKAKIGNAEKSGNGGAGVSAAAAASTLYAIMHHFDLNFLSSILLRLLCETIISKSACH
jgi:hypothetical protein